MIEPLHLGLIGWPLGHSLSPQLHAAALNGCNLRGEYRLYPIPPAPEENGAIQELLLKVRRGDLHGLNVTIPHKQAVIPLLDELTPVAQAVGAVNTIYFRDGHLMGDNTDAPGFLADLERWLASIRKATLPADQEQQLPLSYALVLGAGGAARAVVYALAQSDWQVYLAARRLEEAGELAISVQRSTFSDQQSSIEDQQSKILVLPLESASLASLLDKLNSTPLLIVNTTPAGMAPNVESSPWPAEVSLPRNTAVYDLVYNPPETTLVRTARTAGLPATTGLGMLIEQAALSFECWTGLSAPREAMWQAAGRMSNG